MEVEFLRPTRKAFDPRGTALFTCPNKYLNFFPMVWFCAQFWAFPSICSGFDLFFSLTKLELRTSPFLVAPLPFAFQRSPFLSEDFHIFILF